MTVGHIYEDRTGDRSIKASKGRIVEDQIKSGVVKEVRSEDYRPVCDGASLVYSVGAIAQWIPFYLGQLVVILRMR